MARNVDGSLETPYGPGPSAPILSHTMVTPEVRLRLAVPEYLARRAHTANPLLSQTARFLCYIPDHGQHQRHLEMIHAIDDFIRDHPDDPTIVEAERTLLLLRQHAPALARSKARMEVDRDLRTMTLLVYLSIPPLQIRLANTPISTAAVLPPDKTSVLRRRMRFRGVEDHD